MELGDVLYGISISYIVSCIFYFVVVYLPEQSRRKSAMAIIENRIVHILGDTGIIIAYYLHKNGISESDDTELLKEKIEAIVDFDHDKVMNFSYQYIEKETGNTVPNHTGEYTEEKWVADNKNKVQQSIESIFQIPIILNVDHSLIITLEEIHNSRFWRTGTARMEMKKNYPQFDISMYTFVTLELGKELFKLYTLHEELRKYIVPRDYTFEQR